MSDRFLIVYLFVFLDAETQHHNQEIHQALNRLATSKNTDLQMIAALYYVHLSHHCE